MLQLSTRFQNFGDVSGGFGEREARKYFGQVCAGERAEDLVRRFEEIRGEEQLDMSAAGMLREMYV